MSDQSSPKWVRKRPQTALTFDATVLGRLQSDAREKRIPVSRLNNEIVAAFYGIATEPADQ